MNVLALVGIIWIFSGPWLAREVHTSENALRVTGIDTFFDNDPKLLETFDRIKDKVESFEGKKRDQELFSFVQESLGNLGEVYTQRLTTVNWGKSSNIYSYIRSKDGFGSECLILAVPLDYNASVVYALTFIEMMQKHQPEWLSKDILVLFYPESDYSAAVREFLDAYYGVDGAGTPVGSLYGEEQRIFGRQGYIRQAYPLVIKDYKVNRVSLIYEGINGQLSDIDFYDATRKVFNSVYGLSYDIGPSGFFRKNSFLKQAISCMKDVSKQYLSVLE